jgi:hypothetical protein
MQIHLVACQAVCTVLTNVTIDDIIMPMAMMTIIRT